ncbi:MAG: hypothetical protein ACRDLB_12480 [Actinomycetota bacterium]
MIDAGTALEAALLALMGAGVAVPVMTVALRTAPAALQRSNIDGARVPAVLGAPLAAGGAMAVLVGTIAGELRWVESGSPRMFAAAGLLIVAMGAAGVWDDARGDERPRGFRGHLGALRRGRVTGGLVKLVTGGVAGIAAGAVLTTDISAIVEVALVVALTANLINLTDRAPGRAGKVALFLSMPLVIGGSGSWTVAAAGTIGALLVCMPADLGARGMLGDAGANPLGALIGLGLAASLDEPARLVAIVSLLGLNAASERWSFSRLIESSPGLRALDMWGRSSPSSRKTGGD